MGHKFSLKAWIGMIFHRIVTLDPRKYHDLELRLLVKGQGHYTHSGFGHCPCHNFSQSSWIGIYNGIVTLDPRKCHDLDYDFDPRSLVKGQGHSIALLENFVDRIETKQEAWGFCILTQWFFIWEKVPFFLRSLVKG
jgi:hypothetical protein